MVRVCRQLKPRVVIVENVAGLFVRFKKVYLSLARQLEELGYEFLNKQSPLWNTREHGVPQNRSRVILVGILPHPAEAVAWTPPAPMIRCPKLAIFVDGRGPKVGPGATRRVIDAALQSRGQAGPEEDDVVMDIGASNRFRRFTENFCPPLTVSAAKCRKRLYVHCVKACLSKADKARLQGYPPHWFHSRKAGIAEGVFGQQMGNAVSGNVMMRVWPAVLKAAGFLKKKATIRDCWAELTDTCDRFGMCVPVPERRVSRARKVPLN